MTQTLRTIVAMALCASMVACQSGGDQKDQPPTPPNTQATPSGDEANPKSAGAPLKDGMLVGLTNEEQIAQEFPAWDQIASEYAVDQDAAAVVAGADDVTIDVYLGTWCGDSRREVSRWLGARRAVDSEKGPTVRYIAVDRSMTAGDEAIPDSLTNVPTFYVFRDGKEIGRVVETAVEPIEVDVADIISGKRSGFISATVKP